MAYSPKLAAKIAAMSPKDRRELKASLEALSRTAKADPLSKVMPNRAALDCPKAATKRKVS